MAVMAAEVDGWYLYQSNQSAYAYIVLYLTIHPCCIFHAEIFAHQKQLRDSLLLVWSIFHRNTQKKSLKSWLLSSFCQHSFEHSSMFWSYVHFEVPNPQLLFQPKIHTIWPHRSSCCLDSVSPISIIKAVALMSNSFAHGRQHFHNNIGIWIAEQKANNSAHETRVEWNPSGGGRQVALVRFEAVIY